MGVGQMSHTEGSLSIDRFGNIKTADTDDGMKALSIRQPWAWLILHAGKDIENRDWSTRFRGQVLIHAAKGMTQNEFADACYFAREIGVDVDKFMPSPPE